VVQSPANNDCSAFGKINYSMPNEFTLQAHPAGGLGFIIDIEVADHPFRIKTDTQARTHPPWQSNHQF